MHADCAIETRIVGNGELPPYGGIMGLDEGNLIYAAPWFLDFLGSVTGARMFVTLAEQHGAIVGTLPFAVCEAPGVGAVVNSLPWWGSHGSVVLDRTAPTAEAVRRRLLQRFADEVRSIQPLSSTMILLPAEETSRAVYEEILQPDVLDHRIGQISQLPPPGAGCEAQLLAGFQQKTRNLVRKSLKQGFREWVTDDDWAWSFLAATHAENIAALGGKSKPRSHFDAFRTAFPASMLRLAIAMDGDAPVAGMLTILFNGTVEYITPAIKVEYRSRQPLSFLIFNGMLDLINKGARRWNWGGTWVGQPALHHFKAGFGATDHPYSYLIKAPKAGLDVFRSRKSELGSLFPYFYTYPYGALS